MGPSPLLLCTCKALASDLRPGAEPPQGATYSVGTQGLCLPPPPPPVPSQSSSLHRGERGAAFGPPSCGRDGGGDSHLLTSSLRPQGEGAPALCPLPCPHIQPLLLPAPEVLRLLNPPTPSLTNHLPPLPHGAELGLGLSSAVALDLPCDLGRPLGALRLTLREGHVSGDPEQKGRHRLKCSATGDNP